MLIKFTNCRLAVNGTLVEKDLWVDSAKGVIIDSQKCFYDHHAMPDHTVNLGGKIISPGFIDIQINGAMGMDFSAFKDNETYSSGVKLVNKFLVRFGVTAYCPTLTSQYPDIYKQVLILGDTFNLQTLPHLRPVQTRNPQDGSEILGVHVEGPFLNAGKRGIHSTAVLRTISSGNFKEFESCYGSDALISHGPSIPPAIRIITGAPELNGMMSIIAECKRRHIIFSIGHSTATIETAEQAVQSGATLITHLFNAMEDLHHRDPGIIGLLGSQDTLPRPYFGIICDGIHIHKSCVKLAYRSHPHGTVLVTDAMAQLGLPNGTYDWTNGERITKDGRKFISGKFRPTVCILRARRQLLEGTPILNIQS